jgi:hypothetical protein
MACCGSSMSEIVPSRKEFSAVISLCRSRDHGSTLEDIRFSEYFFLIAMCEGKKCIRLATLLGRHDTHAFPRSSHRS